MDSSKSSLDDVYSKIGFGRFHILAILILGFIYACNVVELTKVTVMVPILSCSWRIDLWQSSIIQMSVPLGMIFGSVTFGRLNDMYGRKRVLVICGSGVLYFGIFCAASPTVIWVIITKFFVGLFIGGSTPTMSVFLTELVPINHRGRCIVCFRAFEPLGAFYLTLITFPMVSTMGWRLWTVLSIVPMIIIIIMALWLPESPRYLLASNRKYDAIKVVNKIARMNKADEIKNIKIVEYQKTTLSDLFHPKYVLTIAICSFVWFVIGISHFSFALLSPIINDIPRRCLQNLSYIFNPSRSTNVSVDFSCCHRLSWDNMETSILSVTGELVAFIIAIILIGFVKRKPYLQLHLLITALVFFLINLCLSPVNMGILMLFGRGAAVAMSGINCLYTSEVFPTTIRGYAYGFSATFLKIGTVLSPLVVNLLMVKLSFIAGSLFFCFINIVACLLIFMLPYETKDRQLLESLDDNTSELQVIKQKK